MARDYTKYTVEGLGENLNKRKLVFTIVKDYVEKNNPSFEELQNSFPDEVQGSKGFIRKESDVKNPKHFNMREPLNIKNGAHVVVSNQWGNNIDNFIECAENLSYKIIESINSNGEKSESEDMLALPENLYLNEFNPDWAEYLILKYINSVDCSDEHSRIKINLKTNHIIPINSANDDSNKKWFGSWDALLSYDNKKNYSSSMLMMFSNDLNDDYGEWRVIWHDMVEGLDDGDYPEGLSDGKLDDIFSGEWFAQIHDFLTQSI
jgi:hypothetical protein